MKTEEQLPVNRLNFSIDRALKGVRGQRIFTQHGPKQDGQFTVNYSTL